MNRWRALRWSCQGAVVLWCAALLSQVGWEPQAERARLATARVRPVPATPASRSPATPEPQPDSEPPLAPPPGPPAAASEAPPRRVGRAELARGTALLDAEGDFPALSFSYEDFPSFRDYARAMAGLGARFVVVRNRHIVGAVDLDSGAIGAASVGPGYSPRARDYAGEPGLAALSRAARERFGAGAVVMMLVPRALDAGLFGGLARVLEERGEPRDRLREIRGRYERGPGGGVRLRLQGAVRRDGSAVSVEALFDLLQIAGAARA